jgi:hypothetical protein
MFAMLSKKKNYKKNFSELYMLYHLHGISISNNVHTYYNEDVNVSADNGNQRNLFGVAHLQPPPQRKTHYCFILYMV